MTVYKIKSSKQYGFTLIELSISIIIIGLMIVGAIQAFKVYDAKQKITRMNSYMVDVNQAIKEFPNLIDPATVTAANPSGDVYGRMPCPAPIDGAAFANIYSSEQNPPTCTGALRVATASGDVFIGKFPAGTLKLRNDYMKDTFGNYLIYAVSAVAVNQTTYNDLGAITVREREVSPLDGTITELAPKTGIQYALVSAGESKMGSLDFNGAVRIACDLTQAESENCIDPTNAAAPINNGTFMVSVRGDGNAADFYDDYVDFEATLPLVMAPSEPSGCEQRDSFVTQEASCPAGWQVVEMSPTYLSSAPPSLFGLGFPPGPDVQRNNLEYFNLDSETGEHFFTSFMTTDTVSNEPFQPGAAIKLCTNQGQSKTKCFNDKVTLLASNRSGRAHNINQPYGNGSAFNYETMSDLCPEGYKIIDAAYTVSQTGTYESSSSNTYATGSEQDYITCGR